MFINSSTLEIYCTKCEYEIYDQKDVQPHGGKKYKIDALPWREIFIEENK